MTSTQTISLSAPLPSQLQRTDMVGVSQWGQPYAYVVIWSGPLASHCPRCSQQWVDGGCPVTADVTVPGAPLWSRGRHTCPGCNYSLGTPWDSLTVTDASTDADLAALIAGVSEQRAVACDRIDVMITARLREQLAEAIDTDEASGSVEQPGAYWEDGRWIAWGYGADDAILTVEQDDL